jgi:hypothetical protein
MLDLRRLRDDAKARAAEIAGLKALRRESGQPRWGPGPQASLLRLKSEATMICAIRARRRGRAHLRRFPWGPFADEPAFLAHVDDIAAAAYAVGQGAAA